MTNEVPGRRVLVEGVVIVASILLAFGIDALWEESQTRGEERAALELVYDELEQEGQRLNELTTQATAASASLQIAELIDRVDAAGASVAIPDTLLALFLAVPTSETDTPVLDGLRESGRVSIIRDQEIRARIANWERAVTNVSESELRARAFVDAQIIPALASRGDVGDILRAAPTPLRSHLDHAGLTRLRADSELEALVSQRYANAEMAVFGLRRQAAAVDALMSSVRRYLDQ